MTIPQARFLMRHADAVDGHRETARLVVDGIIDIAVAGGLVKRSSKPGNTRPEKPKAADPAIIVPETIIPELQAAIEAKLLAKGWQPPTE